MTNNQKENLVVAGTITVIAVATFVVAEVIVRVVAPAVDEGIRSFVKSYKKAKLPK